MELKKAIYKTTGMQRDISPASFNKSYAYENKNIRVSSAEGNVTLSLTNEKGTLASDIKGIGDYIDGTPIGQAVINDTIVIFTAGAKSNTSNAKDKDRIYKLWFYNNKLNGLLLYEGELGFDVEYPIETIPLYENDDIIKVYWTDGLNPPRVINIAASSTVRDNWNDDSFDFVRKLQLKESVNIYKNDTAGGIFAPGVLQYCLSYYDKYGQESNIFFTSPLFYTAHSDRGGSPEDSCSNSFTISVTNPDTNFDYLRIYSILRTSIDATPTCKRVIDIAVTGDTITYVDNGTSGDIIDNTELLYIGGEDVIFGTMANKDSTLFLGDIKLQRKLIDSDVRSYFKGKQLTFSYKEDNDITIPNAVYYHKNNLDKNSRQITTFKYGETYRFGIQFQHRTGKWSEAIFINDQEVDIANNMRRLTAMGVPSSVVSWNLVKGKLTIDDKSIIQDLIDNNYVKARGVIVFPDINERTCICQGILCPTVYNVGDRATNTPFVQSSWFVRPTAAFFASTNNSYVGEAGDGSDIGNNLTKVPGLDSPYGAILNKKVTITNSYGVSTELDPSNSGKYAAYMHNDIITGRDNANAEIQSAPEYALRVSGLPNQVTPIVANLSINNTTSLKTSDFSQFVANNKNSFFVDKSIFTMHSPDIEFDDEVQSIDKSNLKLRIIGYVPLTSQNSDVDVTTSTSQLTYHVGGSYSKYLTRGFYKEECKVNNISIRGWKQMLAMPMWFDEIYTENSSVDNANKISTSFVIYPWHRNGSLNNQRANDTSGSRSAMLDKNRRSILRYSAWTHYFSKKEDEDDSNLVWNAYEKGSSTKTGISGVTIFSSNEQEMVKIPEPENSNLGALTYYGNVDKVITYNTRELIEDGYPIVIGASLSSATTIDTSATYHQLYSSISQKMDDNEYYKKYCEGFTDGVDPIRIKYKSPIHAVIALNYTTTNKQRILPTRLNADSTVEGISYVDPYYAAYDDTHRPFWDTEGNCAGVSQDTIEFSDRFGFLWLGELYNDNVENRFGGQTEEAFENNLWLPAGKAVSLVDDLDEAVGSFTVEWTEGDTYFQRYDCVKTYPYTTEDQNSITDIISFMCETRVNIDGRYDRNRGQLSNFAITTENFNKVNMVYSQRNNFFTYRTINPNKFNLDHFRNTVTWTKSKTLGELVDTWTNITVASTLDLDGDKGPVRALRRWNNNIISFQDTGVAQILYNEQAQISTTEGVPIEIANSGKVNGKRYISNQVGCHNKWSICNTPSGLYFIDDVNKDLCVFKDNISNVSKNKGFVSYFNNKLKNTSIWNPKIFNNFVSYYDNVNGMVYFISKEDCLGLDENIDQFASFYSYENIPYFTVCKDKGIMWEYDSYNFKTYPWIYREGDYNMFFGKFQPFYTTIVANENPLTDKVFTNLEFRADAFDSNGLTYDSNNSTYQPFDTLDVWNEYQIGHSELKNILDRPSSLKRKFRIWRCNIPRASYGDFGFIINSNNTIAELPNIVDTTKDLKAQIPDYRTSRDRIRNPWAYIKLSQIGENTNKTVLHDLCVQYLE